MILYNTLRTKSRITEDKDPIQDHASNSIPIKKQIILDWKDTKNRSF